MEPLFLSMELTAHSSWTVGLLNSLELLMDLHTVKFRESQMPLQIASFPVTRLLRILIPLFISSTMLDKTQEHTNGLSGYLKSQLTLLSTRLCSIKCAVFQSTSSCSSPGSMWTTQPTPTMLFQWLLMDLLTFQMTLQPGNSSSAMEPALAQIQ